jgi:hypothetical protein
MHAQGSLWAILLYDIAEQIELDKLRSIIGVQPAMREPRFKHPAPDYVRFERPPLDKSSTRPRSSRASVRKPALNISITASWPSSSNCPSSPWQDLIERSSRWIGSPEIEKLAGALAKQYAATARPALKQPYPEWISEDYFIIHLLDAPLEGAELLTECGADIAQLVRGETRPLSAGEREEALKASLSYYPSDLLVVGWVAALVYDTAEGAAPAIQLLEYANAQLLEFRYYDDLLTRVLARRL